MIEEIRPEVESGEVGFGEAKKLPEGRYLLFDAGCLSCQSIAASVERESQGWLTARGLGEPEVRATLSEVRPDWKWEPTLLEVGSRGSLAFTGLSMKARMLLGLGPRKAARVAKIAIGRTDELEIGLIQEHSEDGSEHYSVEYIDRRSALKKMGAAGLAAAFLPLFPQGVLAQDTSSEDENAEIDPDSRRKRVSVKMRNMAKSQMMGLWRKDAVCQKMHRMMRNRGMRFEGGRGGWMRASSGRTGAVMGMKYSSSKFYAVVSWKRIGRRIKGCFSINERDGGRAKEIGELDGIVGGEVSDVRMVENPEELRLQIMEKLRNSGDGVSPKADSFACNLCEPAVDQVIIFGCGTTAAIIASAYCFPATVLCIFIITSIQAAVCGLLFFPVDRRQVCVGLGFCP